MRAVLSAFFATALCAGPTMAAQGDFRIVDGTVAFGGQGTGSASASSTASTGQTVAEFSVTDGNREFRTSDARQRLAQSFTPKTNTPAGSVDLALQRTGSVNGHLRVTIERDNGGVPSGHAEASSDAINVSTLPTSQKWIHFTFPQPVSLSAGMPYWLVLNGDTPLDATAYVLWRGIGGNAYPGGEMKAFNGSTWTADRFDGSFRVYAGTGPVAAGATSPSGAPGLLVVKGDDGKSYYVDTRSLSPKDAMPAVGERVSIAAREGSRADELSAMGIERRPAATGNERADRGHREWRRIHGTVQSVQGSQMKLKSDDGQVLDVDISGVADSVRRALAPQEGVTIIGLGDPQSGRFRARYAQQDSSDVSRKPAAVDETAWQRIHGTVQSVSGNNLTIKTDDNRTVAVDMSKVSSAVRGAMSQGDKVTVIGHLRGTQNTVAAEYIQEDRATAGTPAPKK